MFKNCKYEIISNQVSNRERLNDYPKGVHFKVEVVCPVVKVTGEDIVYTLQKYKD